MKKTAVVVGAVVLTLAVAVVGLDLAGWPGLAPRLAERAGFGLQMDSGARMHLLFRPRLESPQLRVVSEGGEELAAAGIVELHWTWGDIWHWRRGAPLRLRLVQADTLNLKWERDAAGVSPWPIQPGKDKTKPTPVPQIDQLVIRQGSARIDDVPLQLHADGHFATQADGHWTADMKGKLREQELALKAEASAGLALLSSPEAGHPPVKLSAELRQSQGSISFVGAAASLLDARALDGQLHVQGRSLAPIGKPFGITLPQTPPLDLQGRLQHESGVWQLSGVKARVGESHLGGDFSFDTRPARPMLSGALRGGPLRLADLGPAVGTDKAPSRAGRVLPDRAFDLPALNAMDARVAVALSQLDLGAASLAPLGPVNTSVVLVDGVLKLENFNAGIAGGELAGKLTLDTHPNPPLWQIQAGVRGMAIERWIKVQTKALTASPVTGRLDVDVNVQGSGRSTAQLLGSLNGPVRLQLEQGSLSHLLTEAMGLDVAQGLGMWIKGDSNLALNCARMDGNFKAGVLRPRTAVMDNSDSRMEMDGRVNLSDETLDLRVVTHPKDFSPLTLRAPVRLQGTLGDPHVALEGKRLAGRGFAALALGALSPPAALLAFLDPGEDLPPLDCKTGKPQTEKPPIKGG